MSTPSRLQAHPAFGYFLQRKVLLLCYVHVIALRSCQDVRFKVCHCSPPHLLLFIIIIKLPNGKLVLKCNKKQRRSIRTFRLPLPRSPTWKSHTRKRKESPMRSNWWLRRRNGCVRVVEREGEAKAPHHPSRAPQHTPLYIPCAFLPFFLGFMPGVTL